MGTKHNKKTLEHTSGEFESAIGNILAALIDISDVYPLIPDLTLGDRSSYSVVTGGYDSVIGGFTS